MAGPSTPARACSRRRSWPSWASRPLLALKKFKSKQALAPAYQALSAIKVIVILPPVPQRCAAVCARPGYAGKPWGQNWHKAIVIHRKTTRHQVIPVQATAGTGRRAQAWPECNPLSGKGKQELSPENRALYYYYYVFIQSISLRKRGQEKTAPQVLS